MVSKAGDSRRVTVSRRNYMLVRKSFGLLILSLAIGALSASSNAFATQAENAINPQMTPEERGDLAGRFVLRWGAHVQRVYAVPVDVWARRMVATFVAADPVNFRASLRRDTFEGAMLQLMGRGHRLNDRQAIDLLRRASKSETRGDALATKVFGSTTNDLVFTPITPCRILDTRNTAAGAIAANSARNFNAVGSDYAAQGGIAGSCEPISGVGAVAMSVTAVAPSAAGYATLYPVGSVRPLAAHVNYAAGEIVNNAAITRISTDPVIGTGFVIYSFAQSHYVVDVVGYFSSPQATALDCINIENRVSLASGETVVRNMMCGSGFTVVSGGAIPPPGIDASQVVLRYSSFSPPNNWASAMTNNSSVSGTFTFHTRCCRVPGR
jgi:hypothetical protein